MQVSINGKIIVACDTALHTVFTIWHCLLVNHIVTAMNEEEIHPASRISPLITPEIIPAKTPETRKPFTDADKLELITAVKEYPFLYNTKNAWFDENPKRQIAWREIGMMIDQPADTCEEVWRSLVSSFKKYRHRKKEGQTLRPWKFDNDMKFLTPYINIRARTRPEPLTNVNILHGNIGEKQEKNIPSTQFVELDESIGEVVDSPKNDERNGEEEQNIDIRRANKQSTANDTQQTVTKIPQDKTHIVIEKPQQSSSLPLNNVGLSTTAVIFDAPEFHIDILPKLQKNPTKISALVEPTIDCANLPEKEKEHNIDHPTLVNGLEELMIDNFSEKEEVVPNIDTRVVEKLSLPTTQILIDEAKLQEQEEESTKKEPSIHNQNVEPQLATNDIQLRITEISQINIVNLSASGTTNNEVSEKHKQTPDIIFDYPLLPLDSQPEKQTNPNTISQELEISMTQHTVFGEPTTDSTNVPDEAKNNRKQQNVDQLTAHGTQQSKTTIPQDQTQIISSSSGTINNQTVIENLQHCDSVPEIENKPDTTSKELEKGLATNIAHKSTVTETAPIDEIDMFASNIAKRVRKFSPLNKVKAKSMIFAVLSEIEMAQIVEDENGTKLDTAELFQSLLL